MTHQHNCDICEKELTVSSSDFPELCIVCGREFLDTIRAVGELTIEMADAYGVSLSNGDYHAMPGVPAEEIEIRKKLNRIEQECQTFSNAL